MIVGDMLCFWVVYVGVIVVYFLCKLLEVWDFGTAIRVLSTRVAFFVVLLGTAILCHRLTWIVNGLTDVFLDVILLPWIATRYYR